MAGNNSQPNADVVADYAKMVELLDADPANKDAANPKNELNMYKEAYMFTVKYYQDNDDKDKAAEYSTLLKEVMDAQNGAAQ